MSRESSAQYHRLINQGVRDRLGGVRSAKSVMVSVDFDEVERLQHDGPWDELAALMADAARQVECGGADFLLLCTNTMHHVADAVEAAVAIPLTHIADPTAERIRADGHIRVGLLGTAFTMEQGFHKGRLVERRGLEVLTPDEDDRRTVHRIIYEELVAGRVLDASREAHRGIIARLVERGAEAVVLGRTEIMLLVGPDDADVPTYDTTTLHAEAAVAPAVAGS